jgi:hypothetical protein
MHVDLGICVRVQPSNNTSNKQLCSGVHELDLLVPLKPEKIPNAAEASFVIGLSVSTSIRGFYFHGGLVCFEVLAK